MRFRQQHLGSVAAVVGLAVASLALSTAGPASADVIEPFGKRYDESIYGDFTTLGNTVMGCPDSPRTWPRAARPPRRARAPTTTTPS